MTGACYKLWRKFFLLILIGCVSFAVACGAEEACLLIGDWAFDYEPTVSVLTVREDGTAVWNGAEYIWEDDGTFLHFKNMEGEEVLLRYLADGERIRIFPAGTYTRTAKDKDEEIFGAWIRDNSYGSSFIFEKDMRFMEDGTFIGTFQIDTEAGTFTLKYQPAIFEDTTCYFTWEGDHMTIEYPWTIVPKQDGEAAE